MELGETVVVADGDDESRGSLAAALHSAGYEVADTDRGDEALGLAQASNPAAVLLEIPLAGLCGYEICRALKAEPAFEAPIIFVSRVRTESYDRIAGLLLGADDYIVSPYEPGELLVRVANLIDRSRVRDPRARWSLTVREREILDLMSEGLRQREIARRLIISPKTVATHVEHILRKLGVRSSSEAVMVAFREQIIHPKPRRDMGIGPHFRH